MTAATAAATATTATATTATTAATTATAASAATTTATTTPTTTATTTSTTTQTPAPPPRPFLPRHHVEGVQDELGSMAGHDLHLSQEAGGRSHVVRGYDDADGVASGLRIPQ